MVDQRQHIHPAGRVQLQAETQIEQFALAWGTATAEPGTSRPLTVRIIGPQMEVTCEME